MGERVIVWPLSSASSRGAVSKVLLAAAVAVACSGKSARESSAHGNAGSPDGPEGGQAGQNDPGAGGGAGTAGRGGDAGAAGSLTGGGGGSAGESGGTGASATGGSGGSPTTGGSGGSPTTGGSGGSPTTGGSGGSLPTDPYSPRSGPFKMLVYSKTSGFRHDSIAAGKTMLQQIGDAQDFQVTFTEANDEFNAEGLGQYEIVFFMNSTGNNFTAAEKQAYETWMTTKNGAFGGVHSATDTENGWAFYSEVTGQYNDLHDICCAEASIQWDPDALDFVAVRGLPNPWVRSEEWVGLEKADEWSMKPGFKILSRVTTTRGTRPVSYVREWANFRSFYTSLGHQSATFQDANVKKHVTAGILWAVRREHLLD